MCFELEEKPELLGKNYDIRLCFHGDFLICLLWSNTSLILPFAIKSDDRNTFVPFLTNPFLDRYRVVL